MMSERMTILVVSCDEYEDMWQDFFNCKRYYWPDCPYNTFLANNERQFSFEGLQVINCGKHAQWSTRTRMALEKIKTKYVCFMLEDFFLSQKVDTPVIEDILDTMSINDIKYYKLFSLSKFTTPYYNKAKGERIIPANLRYGVSLMAAIWEREYFYKIVGDGDYNPWKFEINRNNEAQLARPTDPMCGIYNENNVLNICHMVVQGKYLPLAVRNMKSKGYNVSVGDRGCHKLPFMFVYWLKRVIYPLYNKSFIVKKLIELIGVETVSTKNK